MFAGIPGRSDPSSGHSRPGARLQVVLTGEPALVSHGVALLEAVLEHNRPALASLFQTGVFFFALAYCGSNLVEVGRLFQVRFPQLEPEQDWAEIWPARSSRRASAACHAQSAKSCIGRS